MKEGKYAWILDMDGVVVDNGRFHRLAWEKFCEKYGLLERFRHGKLFGKTNRDYLTTLFGKELPEADIIRYAREKESLYREIYGPHMVPMPGLLSFLEASGKAQLKTALATSGPPENVAFVLKNLGITGYFDVTVDDSMVKEGKPNPAIFLEAAQRLGMPTRSCVVVEDSVHGLEAAGKAGMKAICMNHPEPAEVEHLAVACLPDFTGLDASRIEEIIYGNRI